MKKSNERALCVPLLKKTKRIMKLTTLFSLGVACCISASTYAQGYKLSMNKQNSSIIEILKDIENNSEFTFFFNDNKVNVNKKASINVKDATLDEALAQVLKNTGYDYQIIDRQVLIKTASSSVSSVPSVQQNQKAITGIIKDVNGEPIIGANVVEKGTTNGTVTDIEGRFSLNVAPGATLVVSYIGYTTSEIVVGNKTDLAISLKEDSEMLDEVVVVGYGTQTKVNLTGAVSTIGKDELINRPVTNVSSALQGLTPGVTITSGTGQPGSDGATIRVRGVGTLNNANPYILVDGIETGTFDSIDPNDIESISVLKDAASAAIYGSKAANGVILVTTKRGKAGKATVSYNGNVSFSNVSTLIDRLSSYDYARLYNQLLTQDGASPRFTDEDLRLFQDGTDPYGHPNTVWTDYIYRTGFMHKHSLNVSGGSEDVKYMASAGFLGQEGTLRNSDRQQFNL